MLALTRLRVPTTAAEAMVQGLSDLRDLLAARPGCQDVTLGRSMDDPQLWVLASRWRDVRSYRRTLSAVDVRIAMGAVMAHVVDEPGTFEIVGEGAALARASDADEVGLGEAAAPVVPTDPDGRG